MRHVQLLHQPINARRILAMNDKPPSAISVAMIEMLLDDDDVELSDEFGTAWG